MIYDQGACGSCWAFGATSVMSDRICIHSKGNKMQVILSAENLLSCCIFSYGCDGGFPSAAWDYWAKYGIVSGGLYGSNEGCQPYTIKPCEHYMKGKRQPCAERLHFDTPKCHHFCENKEFKQSYNQSLNIGSYAGTLMQDEKAIRAEIMTNGPVQASFTVYADFLNYKSGVYQHVSGEGLGGHSVRILGWGEEKGTPYWLVANSWNYDWGLEGTFKILRGSDHCLIEKNVLAGLPKY